MAAEDAILRTVLPARRPRRDPGRRVRRHLPARLEGARAVGPALVVRRPRGPRRGAAGLRRRRRGRVVRDADEPAARRSPTSPRWPSIAHGAGARLVVDNTFASPYLQQPLALGADVVVHSTTKYLGGHSDVVGGALVAADPELGERLRYHQNAMGAVAGPFDSWLVLRGIKTLGAAHGPPQRQRRGRRRAADRPPDGRRGALARSGRLTRATSWRPARCGGPAAWSASGCAGARRRLGRSASGPGCSRWPSRSAGSSRSSSTRRR